MFKSIHPISYKEVFKGGLYYYDYRIVDDDFSETWTGACDQVIFNTTVRAGAVINCYAEHNPGYVAYNLMLYHKFMKDNFYWYNDIETEILYNIDHTPGYKHYAADVRNYLSRIDNLKVFW